MKPSTSKGRTALRWTFLVLIFLVALAAGLFFRLGPELRPPTKISPAFQIASPILLAGLSTAARFDFPIGSENGAFAYNAQPFTQNRHLGDDLNGIGGENSDLGDPVFAVADGEVIFAGEAGPGWGNVIIVLHAYEENGARKFVQSYYGHVETILVARKQKVHRGEQIATIGTADGRYWAHLHFEMREFTTPFIGPGYRDDTRGWIDPSAFIAAHRGAPEDDVGRPALQLSPTPPPVR
ncbi:MAG TPA: M23 family metallopeptidase [Chthoniobacterales bacterium]|jgi:murein DD-endopeptidase MepM/ murein hydrolase activator NlpD